VVDPQGQVDYTFGDNGVLILRQTDYISTHLKNTSWRAVYVPSGYPAPIAIVTTVEGNAGTEGWQVFRYTPSGELYSRSQLFIADNFAEDLRDVLPDSKGGLIVARSGGRI